jgi:hypothetical protein
MINTSFSQKVKIKNGHIIKSNNDVNSNICGSILVLSKASKSLQILIRYVTSNEIEYILNNFNIDVYTKLGQELYKIKMDPIKYPEFEQIRNIFKMSLEMLYMYVNLYNRIENCEQIQEELNEKNRIFNNIQLLKERIKLLNNQVNLFEDSTIEMPEIQIKFEYIIYIQKYGYPETGVFDTDLLEEIKELMVT